MYTISQKRLAFVLASHLQTYLVFRYRIIYKKITFKFNILFINEKIYKVFHLKQ